MNITRYSPELKLLWDEHISNSRIPHFMFNREYMDYHSQKFKDCSLIFSTDKNEIVGVLPANENGNNLISHEGLSFGGLILSKMATANEIQNIFECLLNWLKDSTKFKKFIYKRVPDIYCIQPNQEDAYFLNLIGANLIRRDLSTTINLRSPLPMQKMRKRLSKKAIKTNVKIEKSTPGEIWPIIDEVLNSQHNTKPVHSLTEMEKLSSAFIDNIFSWSAKLNEEVVACVVIFLTSRVAHAQYIANSDQGREIGALDLLFTELIENQYSKVDYFDFGISTENQGKFLNAGLIGQKQGFGGRGIVHDFYELIL